MIALYLSSSFKPNVDLVLILKNITPLFSDFSQKSLRYRKQRDQRKG
jgi:hypothetical protein